MCVGEPNWTALRKAMEDEEEHIAGNWGDRQVSEVERMVERQEDVIRKHEKKATGLSLTDSGAASTTKNIVINSLKSREKLMRLDDAIK